MTDFFTKDASKNYDAKNSRLSPITDNLHFLIRLVLKDLPAQSRVLCIGVGTGAEILSLAKEYSTWTFVGVDPSASMLDVCHERLKDAGIAGRCELIHGYAQDLPLDSRFDAALSVLVAHFVKREERMNFYQSMIKRLKTGGYLVNAEISHDMDAPEFPSMLKNWERVQSLMGATTESLQALPTLMKEVLAVLPPSEIETLIQDSGIKIPVRFFQSFMITGWHGRKE